MTAFKQKNKLSGLSLMGLSFLSLVLYVVGSVPMESLHQHFHAESNVLLHSPENEKDTCHQAIYHQDLNNGCHHKSHLSEFKKCSLCDYATHSFHDFFLAFFDLSSPVADSPEDHYVFSFDTEDLFLLFSRGPPAV